MVLRNFLRRRSKTQSTSPEQTPAVETYEKDAVDVPDFTAGEEATLRDVSVQQDRDVETLEVSEAYSPEPEPEAESGTRSAKGLFARLKQGLAKTRDNLVGKMDQLFSMREIDEEVYEELEAILIQADVGVETTLKLMDELRVEVKERRLKQASELKPVLAELIEKILVPHSGSIAAVSSKPTVVLVVGVNGAGKTTTIGKLAYRYKNEGNRVLLGAGDTFRAAAIEQLEVWADRVGVEIIKQQAGSDPAAVAFDAIQAGKARNADVVIIDTAGRLQNKANLMNELSKIYRVVERELGRPADEVLLVVDATTGQNALSQAKHFSDAVPVSGIALTKLDSTAKGGIVVAIASELGIPIKLIGIGEQYDDLRDFDPHAFVAALFDLE